MLDDSNVSDFENSPAPRKMQEIPPALAFAILLELACEQFEVLQRLIRNEIQITCTPPDLGMCIRSSGCIQLALGKSFVANVIRAHRICEHGAGYLTLDRQERRRFLNATPGVRHVRDVNEHGLDVPGNEESKPSLHHHKLESMGSAAVDETSLLVRGPEKIFMGPLNLFDVYRATARMRDLAGLRSPSSSRTGGLGRSRHGAP
jgi:hypothetical protein